jgi:hypothetical protein
MGYQRPTLKLVFDDPEMEGLIVRARRLKIGTYVDLLRAAGLDLKDETNRKELAERIMSAVIDWNLEDEDSQPVPVTPAGFLDQDLRFIIQMSEALLAAHRGVPGPLERPSPAGGQSLEQSIPMEIESPSPEN